MNTQKLFLLIVLISAVLILFFFAFHNPYKNLKNINSKGETIIAFGNSITAGYGIDQSKAFPKLLENMLGEKVINAGTSGDTTEDALKRIENDVLRLSPKIVLVEFGGNDFMRQVPENITKANMEKIIDLIQAKGALVVLIGSPSYGGKFTPVYKAVAREKKCAYIQNILRGVIAHPDLMYDSLHPNEKGHQKIAERLLGVLKDILENMEQKTR